MNHIINQELINQVQINYDKIPLAVFLLGTNGCGKSSLRNYLNLSDIQTNIDPDILNRIYKEKYPDDYQIKAGKQALKMFESAIANGMNICLESTLAGRGTMNRIISTKKQGYYTIAYYIGLNSVELNLERIAMRVANGGHDIPHHLVKKRFYESADNLSSVIDYIDTLHVLDNSDSFFRLQFSMVGASKVNYCKKMEDWATKLRLPMLSGKK